MRTDVGKDTSLYQLLLTHKLVGGLEHELYDFPIILGISSSQLTNIFQRGRLNHQPDTQKGMKAKPVDSHWVPPGGTSEESLGASDAERRGDESSQLIQRWNAGTMEVGKQGLPGLVNIQKTMENHHAINGKFNYKWPFSIAILT